MKYFQFLIYDVWDNDDGFDVNNIHETGIFLKSIPDYPDNKKMISVLKKAGILKPRFRFNFIGAYCDAYILAHTASGRPIGEWRELSADEWEEKTAHRWSFSRPLCYENAKVYTIRK